MSYGLAVWDGNRPADDAAAAAQYEQLVARYLRDDPVLPHPRIAAFVRVLLDRFPEIDTEAGDDSPWAAGP